MLKTNFHEALVKILEKDRRYDPDAYGFLREALDFTIQRLNKPADGPGRHVTGQELLAGIRLYALQEFGPLALRVLNTWGLRRTEDFGEMVFNMVSEGILGKTEQDQREDFAQGYDFEEAFAAPFRPGPAPRRPAASTPRSRRKSEPPPHETEGQP